VPLSLRQGTVTTVRERLDGLVRCEVDGRPCIAYTRVTGPVEPGDTVVVNTQAADLGLGSGGFDVLYANLTRGLGLSPAPRAHVMALPYTPGQLAVRTAEEDAGDPGAEAALDGLPVVCCGLHSQVAPVAAALAGIPVVYVQLQGGALPVSYSHTVRELRERGLVDAAVAVAPCFDGDADAVSAASALLWARAHGAGAVIAAVGPGIVGTGTSFGHGGLAVAHAANTAAALGGRAVVAARASGADPRERHRGVSHHTRTALRLCLGPVAVAWPAEEPGGDWDARVRAVPAAGWEERCAGLTLSHMGRGPLEDPVFFAAAYAAGVLARELAAAPLPHG
jgi:hypothetical protein